MRNRNFQIVVAGVLAHTAQIRFFRETGLVLGPHGVRLTNIVFCEPGTIVYEFVPDRYPNICLGNLAMTCELRYWVDSFIGDGAGHPSARGWNVDLAIAAKRLSEIEAIQADLQR